MSYRLAERGVIRLSDDLLITIDMPEWQDYREWIRMGGLPQPMAAPAGPSMVEVWAEIKAAITAKRDLVMYGGITVDSVLYNTDAASMALLAQLMLFSNNDTDREFNVKAADLHHVIKTHATLTEMFDAVSERVALCFDNEATHFANTDVIAISGLSDENKIIELRAYDYSTGWPT
ncbi:DUF4376 domain-containing protein [Candidatus Nitrotoga sp. M5]|uniref:DUF4376 domain-containing protein n=1 Tax=Candidatus Nitrotoga sp. M5 TaxID=2890409 RepID=UPI001EF50E71|nr:DUF4376 domain-containing protein [Candidatus Nitrotoga sp. M5]CAH1387011.1 conserved hypothetical protein [Candidatus Nitrotoga sp. M5]